MKVSDLISAKVVSKLRFRPFRPHALSSDHREKNRQEGEIGRCFSTAGSGMKKKKLRYRNRFKKRFSRGFLAPSFENDAGKILLIVLIVHVTGTKMKEGKKGGEHGINRHRHVEQTNNGKNNNSSDNNSKNNDSSDNSSNNNRTNTNKQQGALRTNYGVKI